MAAERRAVQAGVLAAVAVASCCVALWSLSPPPQAALVQRAPGAVQLAGAPAWAFKPTKFGPLRRKKWTASRYRVLALWEAAARSTESCMDAVNEIYPDARDDSCEDINRSMAMVQECMRNQRDGYQGLSDSKNGAWDALPQLVDMTHALSNSDREMVAVKLDKSAVFYTLARLEVRLSPPIAEDAPLPPLPRPPAPPTALSLGLPWFPPALPPPLCVSMC